MRKSRKSIPPGRAAQGSTGFLYAFRDADPALTVEQDEDLPMDLTCTYGDISLSVRAEEGSRASFSPDGEIRLECEGEYTIEALLNDEAMRSDWFACTVSGEEGGADGGASCGMAEISGREREFWAKNAKFTAKKTQKMAARCAENACKGQVLVL